MQAEQRWKTQLPEGFRPSFKPRRPPDTVFCFSGSWGPSHTTIEPQKCMLFGQRLLNSLEKVGGDWASPHGMPAS